MTTTDHGKPDDAATIAQIEDTLHTLLTAITEREAELEGAPPAPRFVRASDLARDPARLLDPAYENLMGCGWLFIDPKGGAYRLGIQKLGRALYELTKSTNVMGDIAERVAERDPSNYGLRIDIIDKRWDGIGSGSDIWRA